MTPSRVSSSSMPPPSAFQTPTASFLTPSRVASSSDLQLPAFQTPTTPHLQDSTPSSINTPTAHSTADMLAPPSTPSSFLTPSDHGSDSSSVLTSVSRGKRKASAISGSESVVSSVASDASRKRIRGPSVAVTAQMESAEAMKQVSQTIDGIAKAFASSAGITITTTDVCEQAITLLNKHEDDFSEDDFLDLSSYLSENRTKAVVFAGVAAKFRKTWLDRCLADIAAKKSA